MSRIRLRTFALLSSLFALAVFGSMQPVAADVFNLGPGLTNLELVQVGSPANPADTRYLGINNGIGAVAYEYRIGKYEVTAAQYTDFLNAVAADDTYGLYDELMGTHFTGCQIQQLGSPGSFTYSVASDWANRPVNWVTMWDAMRFVNWLHNGQPTGPQDASTTEDGAYALNGYSSTGGAGITRSLSARFMLPSSDEWYKAAYYDPIAAHYWDYPTGTNTPQSNALVSPDPGNNANYKHPVIGLTIDAPYYRTEVGEFENSVSPFGTFDQSGNVWEWSETVINNVSASFATRWYHGGSYAEADGRDASGHWDVTPTHRDHRYGFRVAAPAVPEPTTLALLTTAWGLIVLCARRSA